MTYMKDDVVQAKAAILTQQGRIIVEGGTRGVVKADLGSTGCPRDLQLMRIDFVGVADVYVSNEEVSPCR